jgi:hypothetical protein
MAPFKSKACWEGTLNEPFIFKNFPKFISQKSGACLASSNGRIKIEGLHEFGRLCHPNEDLAAFSPDAMAGVIEGTPEGNSNYVALVEMKSKCSEMTLSQEMELVGDFGEDQEINIEDGPQLFKASIPDASYW